MSSEVNGKRAGCRGPKPAAADRPDAHRVKKHDGTRPGVETGGEPLPGLPPIGGTEIPGAGNFQKLGILAVLGTRNRHRNDSRRRRERLLVGRLRGLEGVPILHELATQLADPAR